MTGFDVSPAALETFAQRIARGGGGSIASLYLNEAESYRGSYVKLDGDAGGLIFEGIVSETGKVSDALRAGNMSVNTVLTASAYNLSLSADEYRTSDHANAERLDKQYHPTGTIDTPDSDLTQGSTSGSPGAALTAPAGSDSPSLVDHILDIAGAGSISGLALTVLGIFDLDPTSWVGEKFAGDAGAITKAGNAIKTFGAFDLACAGEVADGLATMTASWTGNAASAASDYFADVANALHDRQQKLTELASHYDDLATFVEFAAGQIAGLLATAIDLAVQIALQLGAAGCLAAVPGVNVIIGIVGASTVFRLVRAIKKLVDKWNEISDLVDRDLAVLAGLSAALGDWSTGRLSLPKGSYYNGSQGDGPAAPRPTPRNVR